MASKAMLGVTSRPVGGVLSSFGEESVFCFVRRWFAVAHAKEYIIMREGKSVSPMGLQVPRGTA